VGLTTARGGRAADAGGRGVARRAASNGSPSTNCSRPCRPGGPDAGGPSARLHNTNIVLLFGVGPPVDTHFYVMQSIDGRGLDCLLEGVRRRPRATQWPRPGSASLRASVGSTECVADEPA
jgi:hypothetical protein